MRKSVVPLLVLVFLTASWLSVSKPAFSSADIVEDSWASKASMKVARSGLGVAVVNDKIYAIGGCTISGFMPSIDGSAVLGYRDLEDLGAFAGTNEKYDPEANNWTIRASIPTPRILFATAVYQNKIYCIGGKTNTGYTGVIEVYDPITNTWEAKTPMPTARSDLTACVVNGKIYLLGGEPNGNLNEVYNPDTDSWSTKASIPFATWGPVGAVVEDKIYIIGSSKLQIYNPQNDSWSQGASPLVGAGYGAVVTTGILAPKRIYVIYHKSSDYTSNNCVYDPESDSWTFGADFPTNRFNFGVAVVNDMLYAIGGHTYDTGRNGYVETVAVNEQYTPMGYGTELPAISVVSPENKTYVSSNVSLAFTVNKPALWMGYSLDSQDNVTITGNTTLSGISNGLHNVTVYARDEFENTGASATVAFTIAKETEAFPIRLTVAAAFVVAALVLLAAVGVGLSAYLKKRK